jgi:hypothetical protein
VIRLEFRFFKTVLRTHALIPTKYSHNRPLCLVAMFGLLSQIMDKA